MAKNCVKMDNIFCYFMLFTGVSGYIFKMFCISGGMVLFIRNAPSKSYHKQLFIFLIHFFSYGFYESVPSTLRYYATFKLRKFESLLYKIDTCLQRATTCIGLQAEQIFSVNM